MPRLRREVRKIIFDHFELILAEWEKSIGGKGNAGNGTDHRGSHRNDTGVAGFVGWQTHGSDSGALFTRGAMQRFRLPRLEPDDLVTRFALNGTEVGTNRRKIAPEFPCVLHPIFPDFFNDWVFHFSLPNNSSGEQISGHKYPSFSTIRLTRMRVNGLFKWAKFHVTRMSTPLTAATAI
jgi:hypothetical protein